MQIGTYYPYTCLYAFDVFMIGNYILLESVYTFSLFFGSRIVYILTHTAAGILTL